MQSVEEAEREKPCRARGSDDVAGIHEYSWLDRELRRTGGGMILWHGQPANKARRGEAKPHLITMHLRKGTGAMSI